MRFVKRLALLVPAIRNLHVQRDQLFRSHDRLFAENQEQQSKIAQLIKESRLLSSEVRLLRMNHCKTLQSIEARSRNRKAYALIASTGRTASQWLTDAFNVHPQVFFSHGPDLKPRKVLNASDDRRRETSRRVIEEINTFDFSDIDRYFDLIEARGEYVVYGNIHGLSPEGILESPETYRRRYYTCGVVRHPVHRVQSFTSKWLPPSKRLSDLGRLILDPNDSSIGERSYQIVKAYGISHFDDEAFIFVKAVKTVLASDKHYALSEMPVFQMERLVTDIDYFLGLFHDATAGLVEPTKQFVDALTGLKPIDRLNDESITAKTKFQSWERWKQKYFLDEIDKAGMLAIYERLGYNLRPVASTFRDL